MCTKYKCTIQELQKTDTVLAPTHVKKVSIANFLCPMQAIPDYCPNPTSKVTTTLTSFCSIFFLNFNSYCFM